MIHTDGPQILVATV